MRRLSCALFSPRYAGENYKCDGCKSRALFSPRYAGENYIRGEKMSLKPEELKFSKEHEWVKIEGSEAIIGVTDYAAEQLGDVVHVELPEVESEFALGEAFGSLESVKSVSDAYLPLTGKIVEVNELLAENPGIINEDPYGEGWIAKVSATEIDEIDSLMDYNGYQSFLSEEA